MTFITYPTSKAELAIEQPSINDTLSSCFFFFNRKWGVSFSGSWRVQISCLEGTSLSRGEKKRPDGESVLPNTQ